MWHKNWSKGWAITLCLFTVLLTALNLPSQTSKRSAIFKYISGNSSGSLQILLLLSKQTEWVSLSVRYFSWSKGTLWWQLDGWLVKTRPLLLYRHNMLLLYAWNGKKEDAAKATGILEVLKSEQMVKYLHFMIDVTSRLSVQFKKDDITINEVVCRIEKSITELKKLEKGGVHHQRFCNRYSEQNGKLVCGKDNKQELTLTKKRHQPYAFLPEAPQWHILPSWEKVWVAHNRTSEPF